MNFNISDHESCLLIQNQSFLNEKTLAEYIEWDALAGISFVSCHFEDFEMTGNVFGSSCFQNCTFNKFYARKATFSSCHFEGCRITNADMTRADFYDTYFKNCEFLSVNLRASHFHTCKLELTRFLKNNLTLIGVKNVKVWKSKEWVEIQDFSSFQKHLDEYELEP